MSVMCVLVAEDCNRLLVELIFEGIVFNQLQMRQNNRWDAGTFHTEDDGESSWLSFFLVALHSSLFIFVCAWELS